MMVLVVPVAAATARGLSVFARGRVGAGSGGEGRKGVVAGDPLAGEGDDERGELRRRSGLAAAAPDRRGGAPVIVVGRVVVSDGYLCRLRVMLLGCSCCGRVLGGRLRVGHRRRRRHRSLRTAAAVLRRRWRRRRRGGPSDHRLQSSNCAGLSAVGEGGRGGLGGGRGRRGGL